MGDNAPPAASSGPSEPSAAPRGGDGQAGAAAEAPAVKKVNGVPPTLRPHVFALPGAARVMCAFRARRGYPCRPRGPVMHTCQPGVREIPQERLLQRCFARFSTARRGRRVALSWRSAPTALHRASHRDPRLVRVWRVCWRASTARHTCACARAGVPAGGRLLESCLGVTATPPLPQICATAMLCLMSCCAECHVGASRAIDKNWVGNLSNSDTLRLVPLAVCAAEPLQEAQGRAGPAAARRQRHGGGGGGGSSGCFRWGRW